MKLDATWKREATELRLKVKKGWPYWAGIAPEVVPSQPERRPERLWGRA